MTTKENDWRFYDTATERRFIIFGDDAWRAYDATNKCIQRLDRRNVANLGRMIDKRLIDYLADTLTDMARAIWATNPVECIRREIVNEPIDDFSAFEQEVYERFHAMDPAYIQAEMARIEQELVPLLIMTRAYKQQLSALRGRKRISLRQLVEIYRQYDVGRWAFTFPYDAFMESLLPPADLRRYRRFLRMLPE